MGNNSNIFDNAAHIRAKTNKELELLVRFWEIRLEFAEEARPLVEKEYQLVKSILAERIGKE